jgi:hypothetical protein
LECLRRLCVGASLVWRKQAFPQGIDGPNVRLFGSWMLLPNEVVVMNTFGMGLPLASMQCSKIKSPLKGLPGRSRAAELEHLRSLHCRNHLSLQTATLLRYSIRRHNRCMN